MDMVVSAFVIYFFLLVVFRIAGARSLAQITAFDLVLLLVIAEAVQQGLIGEDFSLTNALVLIVSLIGIDIGLSLLKQRFHDIGHVMDSRPLIIVERGKPIPEHMAKARVDEEDVLSAARQAHGLRGMAEVDYAVLEASGAISIIPRRGADST